jgi:hypothetical protein
MYNTPPTYCDLHGGTGVQVAQAAKVALVAIEARNIAKAQAVV